MAPKSPPASERTPLLASSPPTKGTNSSAATGLVEGSAGLVPDGTAAPRTGPVRPAADAAEDWGGNISNRTEEEENTPLLAETSDNDDIERSNALERTASAIDRERHYRGKPEERKRLYILLPALSIGIFLAAADQSIVATSYGRIGSDLGALQKTGWIATGYFMTLTAFQPLYGKLSDIFSRKGCLLFAYLVFGVGTLGCGLARDIDELIVARAVAGMGGGGMTTVVSILLSDIIPLKERGKWQGYLNIIYATGAAVGSPLGGFMASGPGWRWAFLFQPPLCLLAFLAVFFLMNAQPADDEVDVKSTDHGAGADGNGVAHANGSTSAGEAPSTAEPNKKTGGWAKFKRIDFFGSLTLVCAVFSLLVGFDRGSNVRWGSVDCLVPLCLSFPLFAAFVYVEMRVAAEPIMPGRIVFERTLFACFLCNFFSFAGAMGAIFYVPLYYQAVKGYSPLHAALLLLPQMVAGVSGSLFAGFYMARSGKYRALTIACYAGLVAGLVLIMLFSGLVASSDVGVCVALVIFAFSNGVGVTTTLIALIANAVKDDQAIATACSYLFRSLGATIGVSLSATVLNQTLRVLLAQRLKPGDGDVDAIVEGVIHNLDHIRRLAPYLQDVVRRCYGLATRAAFGLQTCVVAGAFVAALFIREKPLSR